MHLEQVATATTPTGDVEATMSGDFSGDDLDVALSFASAGQTVHMDMVVLGETAYVRQGDADWVSVPKQAAEAHWLAWCRTCASSPTRSTFATLGSRRSLGVTSTT